MTPITGARPSPPRARSPSSPTTRHVRSNIRSTSISMPSAISWNAASQNSSSSAASQPASKRPPEITGPSSLSLPSSYGCDKCPHHLAAVAVLGVLADMLDGNHMLVFGGVEYDDPLGRAPRNPDALDRTADQLTLVGHQHDLVAVLDRE